MYNNFYGAGNYIGGFQPGGYAYQQNQNPPKYTNPLTAEEIKSLRQKSEKFTLELTREESLRGICFHRDENGIETLRENPDGTVTCTICGHTFDPVHSLGKEDLMAAVTGIVDVLQTIKLLYLDMPVEVAREYFQIIPLIEKAPELFTLASDNFKKHENYNNFRFNGAPNATSLYGMLAGGQGFSNPYQQGGFAPQQAQPGQWGQPAPQQYAPQQAQPGQWGQPAPQQYAQQGAPVSNGFGYNGPVAPAPNAYQPATAPGGYQYNPNQPVQQPYQPQVAPEAQTSGQAPTIAPVNVQAGTDGKEVTVNATFKS